MKILLLTSGELYYSILRLREELEQRSISNEIVLFKDLFLRIAQNTATLENIEGMDFQSFDGIIPRSTNGLAAYLHLFTEMKMPTQYLLNERQILVGNGPYSKRSQYFLLSSHNIPLINSIMPAFEEVNVENLKLWGCYFPLIVKGMRAKGAKSMQLSYSLGNAVHKVNSVEEINSLISLYGRGNVILQEYIPNTFDLRVLVLGKKVLGVIKRSANNDFRNNYSKGGSVSPYSLTKQIEEISVKAANILQLDYCGVDLIETSTGYMVMEVNHYPQFEGFEKATGINVAGAIVDFIVTRVTDNLKNTQ